MLRRSSRITFRPSGARPAIRCVRASWYAEAPRRGRTTPRPRRRRWMSERLRLPALALLLLCGGCATIVQGSTQMVQVTSTPPGAHVLVLPENASLVTPGEIDLARNQVHTLLF